MKDHCYHCDTNKQIQAMESNLKTNEINESDKEIIHELVSYYYSHSDEYQIIKTTKKLNVSF
jgi:hypothetical protein